MASDSVNGSADAVAFAIRDLTAEVGRMRRLLAVLVLSKVETDYGGEARETAAKQYVHMIERALSD